MLLPTLLIAAFSLFGSAISYPAGNSSQHSSTAKVGWLGGNKPSYLFGATFGLPWAVGTHYPDNTTFSASSGSEQVHLQSWVTGYWPDGSAKWTGHAIPASNSLSDEYTITASYSETISTSNGSLIVTDDSDKITVNTGKLTAVFPKDGNVLVESITTSSGKIIGQNGRLVLQYDLYLVHILLLCSCSR